MNTEEKESEKAEQDLGVVNARYRIVRKLGRGGMGTVFLAEDVKRGRRLVALKRVRSDKLDEKTLASLRNEFLSLAALDHPNVARVYDFGFEWKSRDVFFTSEFVEGPDWHKLAASFDLTGEEGFHKFLEIAVGVLRGLEFVHCRGLVHLDLKPENILIQIDQPEGGEGEPIYCPKVIDFGLAKEEKKFGGKKIMGTTYYIAPETILAAQVDRRTDLYSLGVVLYQLAARRLPFVGRSNLELFKGHLETKPVPPHEIASYIPRQFSEIILCLMEKKPARRFQTALEVVEEINRQLGTDFPLETEQTMESWLGSGRTSGREEVIERLHGVVSVSTRTEPLGVDYDAGSRPIRDPRTSSRQGADALSTVPRGRMVIVRGERGLGKRRIAETLKHLVQTQGVSFLEVECGGAGGRDWRSLLREIAIYAGSREIKSKLALAAMVGEALGRKKGRGTSGCATDGGRDGSIGPREKGLGAPGGLEQGKRGSSGGRKGSLSIKDLAGGLLLASRKSPLVIHLHDLHKARDDVIRMVKCLVGTLYSDAVVGSRILITASIPDQADTEGTLFQGLYQKSFFRHGVCEVKLERLDAEGVTNLIKGIFAGSEFPEKFLRRVYEESDGNGEIILDILRFFLRKRVLRRSSMGWLLDGDYETQQIPGRARLELIQRINDLPANVMRLAMAFAYLGEETELELAARMAGMPAEESLECASVLKKARLIQEKIEGDPRLVFSFVHSSARDILYNLVPESLRAREHQRAGTLCEDYFEKKGVKDPAKLALHFLKARDLEKGKLYGCEAAKAYRSDLKPLLAVEVYRQILGLLGERDAREADALRREIAELLFEIGDYENVVETLDPLLKSAAEADGAERSRLLNLMARVHGKLGRFERAAIYANQMVEIQESGAGGDRELADLLLTCAELHESKGNLVESLRCCDRFLDIGGESSESELQSQLHMVAAKNHYRLENVDRAIDHCQKALRILDGLRNNDRPDHSLYCLAQYYKLKGKYKNALRQFELAAEVAQKLGAGDRQADALLEVARLHLGLGRPHLARPALLQANRLYWKTGNVPMSIEVLCDLGEAHRLLGEYDAAKGCLGEAMRRSDVLGAVEAGARAKLSYAGLCLDSGDVAGAESHLKDVDATAGRILSNINLKILEHRVELAIERGDYTEAFDLIAKATVSEGRREDRIASAPLVAKKALLQCRFRRKSEARRSIVALLELAEAVGMPICEGRARCFDGMLLSAEGRHASAERSFTKAAEIFLGEGSERDLAALYLEQGDLCMKQGRFEETYLFLEEGFYLAKKLNLNYMKCRYYFSMGVLETLIAEDSLQRGEERFRYAEHIARKVPYGELLWQIELFLGKVLEHEG
ncbi:MAG: protein kinase, partial [Planctomycetes bacterium]|nr:protein kinase [Planctomycetota bacterium]